jgi:hypothetical protein
MVPIDRCLSTFLGDLVHFHLVREDGIIVGIRGLLNNIIVSKNNDMCLILLVTKEGEKLFQIGGKGSYSYKIKQINVKSEVDKALFKIEYNL